MFRLWIDRPVRIGLWGRVAWQSKYKNPGKSSDGSCLGHVPIPKGSTPGHIILAAKGQKEETMTSSYYQVAEKGHVLSISWLPGESPFVHLLAPAAAHLQTLLSVTSLCL